MFRNLPLVIYFQQWYASAQVSISFHSTSSTCHWKAALARLCASEAECCPSFAPFGVLQQSHIDTEPTYPLAWNLHIISNLLSIYKTVSFRWRYRPSFWEEAVKMPRLVTVKTRLANTLGVIQTEERLLILRCSCFFTDLSLKYTKRHCFFKLVLGMLFWEFPEAVTDKGYLELCWIT